MPVSVLSGEKLSFNVPTPVVLSGLDVGVSKSGGTVGGSSTITVVGPTHFLADTRSGFGANIFGTGRLVIAGSLERSGVLSVDSPRDLANPLNLPPPQTLELATATQWHTNAEIRMVNAILRNMSNAVYEFAGGGNVSGLTFENYGLILKRSPETNVLNIGSIFGGLFNWGTLSIQAGRLNISAITQFAGKTVVNGGVLAGSSGGIYLMISGGDFEIAGGELVPGDVQLSGGRMNLVNAVLDFGGSYRLAITGGIFTGTGTVGGLDVFVMPGNSSPGLLKCPDGEYAQNANGKLTVEIGGAQPGSGYDQFQAIKASLDGILEIHLINGFIPDVGDAFTVLATPNKTPVGQFATTIGDTIDGTKKFEVIYDDGGVTLRVVAVP